jgi:hypothetical protein
MNFIARLGFLLWLMPGLSAFAEGVGIAWKPLQKGLDYATLEMVSKPTVGDGKLHVVRIDPKKAQMSFALANQYDKHKRTAADWCRQAKMAVAINAGMFGTDQVNNVGYLRNGKSVYTKRWNGYRSALVFGPEKKDLAPARMIDLDQSGEKEIADKYSGVVQNLRLIKVSGKNVWQKQERKWSEAAIAMDDSGHILFLFSRTPLSVWDFNEYLLKSPLAVARAMHVEGGPEASLSIHAGGIDLDLQGSFESGFWENDDNHSQWPIPNVLGVNRD